jgi:hypothetical protein
MDGTTERRNRFKTRALLIRCTDEVYDSILKELRTRRDCSLVFSRTAGAGERLTIREEVW